MPPKNKSTKNQSARPQRSCGAPTRYGDSPGSSHAGSSQVDSSQAGSSRVPPSQTTTPTASDDDNDDSQLNTSNRNNVNPHAHGLLNPHEQILEKLTTLTQLTLSQKMDLEKNNRNSESMSSQMTKMQQRLNKLEREVANKERAQDKTVQPAAKRRKQTAQEEAAVAPKPTANKETRKTQAKNKAVPQAVLSDSDESRDEDDNEDAEVLDESSEGEAVPIVKESTVRSKKRTKSKKKAQAVAERKKDRLRKGEPSDSEEDDEVKEDTTDSDDDDDDDSDDNRFFSSYGHKVGNTLPKKIMKLIEKDDFVEFSEVLPQLGVYREEEYSMKMKGNTSTFVKKRNIRNLPWHLWLKACDIWIAASVKCKTGKRAINLMQDLLTYKKNVELVMRRGHDFNAYDRHFRMEQAVDPTPWGRLRDDLMLEYPASRYGSSYNSSSNSSYRNNQGFRKGRRDDFRGQGKSSSFKTPEGLTIKSGMCYDFHSKSKHCRFSGETCKYQHRCPCGGAHPVFSCKTPRRESPKVPQGGGKPGARPN